ncbi:rho guanine nucleotide exchange factor 2-like [Mugil cephalus]|uniref:rho guanine nucleotide exchange factor 2-like n=1 Tax=Mugil cephalus TaxID=48193 RepID=UPI001FB75FE5|nr:rho guanine nucleotide exchange factor 2-like [Mugil cephalus]
MSRVTNLTKLRQERMREINLRNKDRERMREQDKVARDREAYYRNGHLFASLAVSGTTLCSACNKSITAMEALSCPTCNVTIHNRCRDTLPNCAKMKQKQKMALLRNNVTLRTKPQGMHERPTSAIYPSNSFRQSLLGSRRVRSSLSLSKSVSTNNIAGSLNDDLGLSKILSQSTDSLSFKTRAISVESLNDDGDMYFTSVLEEMELEAQDFKADSWSMAVDNSYLQTLCKNVIKRQEIIYELIQTELHHVRTLHIMEKVFRQGMLEELQFDLSIVHTMFPCLDRLIRLHSQFLEQLILRRNNSLQSGSSCNYTIHKLGDILLEQFSGQCADDLQKTYAEFCSCHLKAVKLYKELLAKDKRFQFFIKRVSRGPFLRCHGVQECILLVTQRISKYPVLIERILTNTTDDHEERHSLAQALSMVKELLSSVDQKMEELKKTQRLQEIQAKLDPDAKARARDGQLFKPGELLRRRLIHDGILLWKTPGSRLKDIQVLLMTDILVFLQEKDQKYIFPCLDKPPVLSLQNLIVRDIANKERGMFLINNCSPPEMYELHAASKEDKNIWIQHIQHTISRCPSREEFPLIESEHKAHLRRLKADLQQKDHEILELLQERVTLFCEMAEVASGQKGPQPPISRYLFRADTPQASRAEKLLLDATAEGERLTELLLGTSMDIPKLHPHSSLELVKSSEQDLLVNGANHSSYKEIYQGLVDLSVCLHVLQEAVIKQDSVVELLLQPQNSAPTRAFYPLCRDAESQEVTVGSTVGELALLQRQHSLLQEELLRLRDAESRFKYSERARAKLEKQVQYIKGCSGVTLSTQPQGKHVSEAQALILQSGRIRTDTTHATYDYQSDGPQEGSDLETEVTSDDDDDDDDDDGNASENSKDQDIPEEI